MQMENEIIKETVSEGVVNIVRGLTRPALTFWGLVSWTMMHINGIEIPDTFTWLVWGMVVWWFGDRTWLKLKTILGKGVN
ncbi:hypothetical protein KKF82_08765 [Patescibacteria group bacterium]|nr:hypothetical protein [Patescibacteria group bacterium]